MSDLRTALLAAASALADALEPNAAPAWLAPEAQKADPEEMITPTVAAAELGRTPAFVRDECAAGRIQAEKHGTRWAIARSELNKYRQRARTRSRLQAVPQVGAA